jgi:hypothetical protein
MKRLLVVLAVFAIHSAHADDSRGIALACLKLGNFYGHLAEQHDLGIPKQDLKQLPPLADKDLEQARMDAIDAVYKTPGFPADEWRTLVAERCLEKRGALR